LAVCSQVSLPFPIHLPRYPSSITCPFTNPFLIKNPKNGSPSTNNLLDKCKPLASTIPNLWAVSSIDSLKKAKQLNLGRSLLSPPASTPLNVHIQVNTSGESSKSGSAPGAETLELCRFVKEQCPHLHLLGLMTIGAIARSKATTPENENEDFMALRREKEIVEKELGGVLELSMGMSDDFEGAIGQGSDEVRVGSTIFGERPPKAEFKVSAGAGRA
jgi:pyridoxal phosphate enzyme (YggS family)